MLTEPCRGFVTRIECFLGCRPCSAVHARTDVQCKAEAIAALPDFVKRSSRMLILWDETYFERLWCNVEIVGRSVAEKSTWPNDPVHLTQPKQLTDEAVFLKSHPDPSAIRMIPLWLSPWLLCSLLLEWVCARYTVPLMFMLLAEWSWVSGAPPQSRLDWVLRNVIFCLTSTVAHLPSALLATPVLHSEASPARPLVGSASRLRRSVFKVHCGERSPYAGGRDSQLAQGAENVR